MFFEIVMLKPVTGPSFRQKYWYLAILGFHTFYGSKIWQIDPIYDIRKIRPKRAINAWKTVAKRSFYFAILGINHQSKVITTGKIKFWKVGVVTTPLPMGKSRS